MDPVVCEFKAIPSHNYAFRLAVQEKDSKLFMKTSSDIEFPYENVALTKAGSTCSASSIYDKYYCTKTIDGNMISQWLSVHIGGGNDIWIQVNFKAEKIIFQIALVHRRASSTGPREVTLKFSDDSEQLFSDLRCDDAAGAKDILKINLAWTTFVKVTFITECFEGNTNFGLAEIIADAFILIEDD
ncbi:hypothetical protein LSH36_1228g00016 [Paralvinella palmiformis]|uniref:F5/8 type C domain-containing protein n=1 Tax=Paralvinella palmiformis TaxID=53620 RepID=A0AAD9ITU8_9ANNE|nr:hypothetical protein LSH36_1228g00016 [Paralvinella palmiformis]